jgi:hypothetical protein
VTVTKSTPWPSQRVIGFAGRRAASPRRTPIIFSLQDGKVDAGATAELPDLQSPVASDLLRGTVGMLIIPGGECERRNGELRGSQAEETLRRGFQAEEHQATENAARWIEHPAVLHDRAAASRRRDGRDAD